MAIIKQSSYKAKWFFKHPHISTILPAFRIPAPVKYQRVRLNTPDNDFFDIDYSKIGSKSIAILAHGLEGSSHSPYMTHATWSLNEAGIDVAAMNYRSCSGEANNLINSYHSGKTEDLAQLIEESSNNYDNIYLVGFSIGGNITLKYLGEQKDKLAPQVKKAVVFAVPFCLEACAYELSKPQNWIYMKYFLIQLQKKIKAKMKKFPGQIDDKDFSKIKSFYDYDRRYTAPLNGFKDEIDYWTQASCKRFLEDINIPTLIVTALNDPFLAGDCYPFEICRENPCLLLDSPQYGGHMGFGSFSKVHWWQERMLAAITSSLLEADTIPVV